jgi:hypothetical protein
MEKPENQEEAKKRREIKMSIKRERERESKNRANRPETGVKTGEFLKTCHTSRIMYDLTIHLPNTLSSKGSETSKK